MFVWTSVIILLKYWYILVENKNENIQEKKIQFKGNQLNYWLNLCLPFLKFQRRNKQIGTCSDFVLFLVPLCFQQFNNINVKCISLFGYIERNCWRRFRENGRYVCSRPALFKSWPITPWHFNISWASRFQYFMSIGYKFISKPSQRYPNVRCKWSGWATVTVGKMANFGDRLCIKWWQSRKDVEQKIRSSPCTTISECS